MVNCQVHGACRIPPLMLAVTTPSAPPDLTPLYTTRYLAAVGVTAFVYYVVLSFGKEIDMIWRRKKWDTSNVCFMWNRYSSLAGLIFGAYRAYTPRTPAELPLRNLFAVTSGLHSSFSNSPRYRSRLSGANPHPSCKASYVAVTSVAIIAIGTSHAFLAMWMWARWEHQRGAKLAMWTAFAVTFAGLFASFVLGAKSIYDSASYASAFNVCVLSKNPKALMGVWISTLTFDVVTVALLIINAFAQPYRQRAQIVERVKRDGVVCFIIIIVGSLVMLVISVAAGTNGTFEAAFIVWSCDAIVVSWLVLEVPSPDAVVEDLGKLPSDVYELGVRKGGSGTPSLYPQEYQRVVTPF
ncbi:hypothetical protein NM688_g3636 [Phlebia brevispora]|uniref:Uncharacterized protein n=1 Tax=Phlebia brevispora TaxID=194682 RepID=A0ACC1T540_9APHY|nr:hypothetical protein NM688_g3636 [Phlebia brevispora]